MTADRPDLAGLELPELEGALEALGARKFHARQMFRWIYRRGVTDFAAMTDLARDLRQRLAERFVVSTPVIRREDTSADGTRKLLLELGDGRLIESVFIPDTPASARGPCDARTRGARASGESLQPTRSAKARSMCERGEPSADAERKGAEHVRAGRAFSRRGARRRGASARGGGAPRAEKVGPREQRRWGPASSKDGAPRAERMTFCLSTQVGCAMRCAFCLTGKMGLERNLTAGEIVGQVRVLARELDMLDRRFNIVLMGMGEPLHNYDETMKALRILADAEGLAVSPRRMTLSTVGVLPALERLATEPLMPNLAVSLHATTEELRDRLVPINRKYGVADLIDACRRFPLKRRNRITFEYVLLDGINDTPEDARRLVRLLGGVKAKVNLLPLNEAPGIPFGRPSDERVNRFAQILADHHITVSVRKSRGRDIRAACGQLIVEGRQPSPGQRLAAML